MSDSTVAREGPADARNAKPFKLNLPYGPGAGFEEVEGVEVDGAGDAAGNGVLIIGVSDEDVRSRAKP